VAIENARLYETVRQELAEREQAERTLSRRAAQLALLSDIGGKIAAVSDLEGVLDRVARLVQESFGYHHVGLFTLDREQDELVMRAKAGDFVDLYPPNHRLKVDQGMVGWVGRSCQSLLANDVDAESRYVNLYPNVVPTRSELCVPILVGGEIVGVLDIQSPQVDAFDENDVTALETLASQIAVAIEGARLYEALRVSEERYRAVSRLAADFAYAIRVDPDGSIEFEWVTAAFTRLTGYTEDEVAEHDGWKRVIYPDDLPTVLAYLKERLAGQSNEAEYRILTKDGRIRWWHDYGRPEWDESREHVVRIYGAAQDVTERKRMEEYVLHTERLAAMGHMAAALTHEIESPLRIVQEHLSLALEPGVEPTEHAEHLRLCQQEIEHLAEIAERVLGLAEPVEDAARPASIDDLVQRALALLKKPLLRAPFEIKIEIPADLPPVQIVPDRIVQALVNLIINSIEAMPDGGEMYIAARQVEGELVLTLVNDGPHIPPEDIEQVFDPFFTTKAEGAGLGLYISQNIVEQHGGTISVENLPGERGVAFTATLPVADSV
jgi:PAS domain S-box-containing protein